MRRGEIYSLEWSEVQFNYNRILLSETKTKGKRSGLVPVSPVLQEVLKSLDVKGKYVVADLYTMDQLRKQWGKLIKILPFGHIKNGTNFRFHDLRHLTAQTLLNEGLDMTDVQHILRHQHITTTQARYAQFSRPDLIEKGARIDNILPFKRVI